MAAEAPRYWPKIQALREAERRVQGESATLAAQETQRLQLKNQSVKMMEDILRELVENDPILQKTPFRGVRKIGINYRGQETILAENADATDVDIIQVRWGNKFELTPEEQAILTRYEYRPIKPPPQTPELPQEIIVNDYHHFTVDFHTDFLVVQHHRGSIGYRELLRDQEGLLAKLNKCVEYPPFKAIYTQTKGVNYWKDPPAPTLGNRFRNFWGKLA